MKKVLNHILKTYHVNEDTFECLICKIKYIYMDYEGNWIYIPSTKIGPIYLDITCEEQQFKNLLE